MTRASIRRALGAPGQSTTAAAGDHGCRWRRPFRTARCGVSPMTCTLAGCRFGAGCHKHKERPRSMLSRTIRHLANADADRAREAGRYLTDGVDLYRSLGAITSGMGEMVGLENCRSLDVVLLPIDELRARRMRAVSPADADQRTRRACAKQTMCRAPAIGIARSPVPRPPDREQPRRPDRSRDP